MTRNQTPRCVRILTILALVAMVLYTIFFFMIVCIPQSFYQSISSPFVNSDMKFATPWASIISNCIIMISYYVLIFLLLKKTPKDGWNRNNTFKLILLTIIIPIVQTLLTFIFPAIELQIYLKKANEMIVAYNNIIRMLQNISRLTQVTLLLCVSAVSILRYHVFVVTQLEAQTPNTIAQDETELSEPLIEIQNTNNAQEDA